MIMHNGLKNYTTIQGHGFTFFLSLVFLVDKMTNDSGKIIKIATKQSVQKTFHQLKR